MGVIAARGCSECRCSLTVTSVLNFDMPSVWRSCQLICPDRLGHTVEDQSHAHGGEKEADNACRRVNAARADAAEDYVGVGKEQERRAHRRQDGEADRSQW